VEGGAADSEKQSKVAEKHSASRLSSRGEKTEFETKFRSMGSRQLEWLNRGTGASKSFVVDEDDDILAPRIISEIKSQIIEVPVVEDVVRYVPKIEVVEVEKKVPKIEVQYIEKIVEVPFVRIVDKIVEVDQVQEVVNYVPRKEEVPVPREVIRYVPKVHTNYIEKVVEVISSTKIIEIRKPYIVEQKVRRPVYRDKEVACVVSQKLIPIIRESNQEHLDVEVCRYVPKVIQVDVYVPVPIQVPVIPIKKNADEVTRVQVSSAQYNSLMIGLNQHFKDDTELIEDMPYLRSDNGTIQLLIPSEFSGIVTLAN